ncbi:copper resistance CopC family protein [Alkalihalobacillus pseudalcaliphilus]|uniref:copper resistance CopC family protein n=1 Tax=Alkalihalobacillus pseudalcaliphilus TaxID=79884 RepID=UPI00064DAFAD|nr:copper resistance protein CopC [Alkalihalobacillus pseudalcaliphilus]KMK77739.1 hypothetical protein AB990_04605 [Alkalihalobacillus pseudalcaliphilus]
MLKRITQSSIIVLVVMGLMVTQGFAHTHLESSTPSDGETVDSLVKEVVIEFDGGIEPFAEVIITDEQGNEISDLDIQVEASSIKAIPGQPLSANTYTVDWSIISEDTHPMEGSFLFTVTAEAVEEVEPISEVIEEATEEEEAEEDVVIEGNVEEEEASSHDHSEESETQGFPWTTVFIIAVLVLGLIIVITMIKKKK